MECAAMYDMRHNRNLKKGMLGRALWVHFPSPWLFEPAERPDDRADYDYGLDTRR